MRTGVSIRIRTGSYEQEDDRIGAGACLAMRAAGATTALQKPRLPYSTTDSRAMTLHHIADCTIEDHTRHHDVDAQHARHRRKRGHRLSPGYDDRTLAPISDAELLARVASKDRRSLEVLYERHAGWLQIRLERRCGDPELADLALQDTFLSVWKSAAKWRGEGEVAAWIWGIAIRRLVDQLRKAGRRVATSSIDATGPDERPHEIEDKGSTPEQSIVEETTDPVVSAALEELPHELLDVVLATTVDGLTNREAADLLDIPIGTLKTRARRAKAILKESLR